MEQPEPEAASDDAMDAFLEKFQSQPYRGGFHEDRWEEVGGPVGSAHVGASCGLVGLLAPRRLPQPPGPGAASG